MIERIRQYFILGDSQLKLYALATLTGLLAGLTIIAFRLVISSAQLQFLPSGIADNFSNLSWYLVMGLPMLGGLFIGLMFHGLDARPN